MKPINVTMPRVNIEIGDILYLRGIAKALIVKDLRSNRREISGALTTTPSEVTISTQEGWAKGNIPDRIVRLQALGIVDITGTCEITELKIGNDSLFSLNNVDSVVLNTNTIGESGGENAIGQLRWGPLPIDTWIWDSQQIIATCVATAGTPTIVIPLDVLEVTCGEIPVTEIDKIAPYSVVVASRHGCARKLYEEFARLRPYLT
jgi:hypothetical protein